MIQTSWDRVSTLRLSLIVFLLPFLAGTSMGKSLSSSTESNNKPIFVSWDQHSMREYSCPDDSKRNPLAGTPVVISQASTDCDDKGNCNAVGVSMVGVVGTPSKTCSQDWVELNHQIFNSKEESDKFIAESSTIIFTNWKTRPATKDDMVKAVLQENGWSLDRQMLGYNKYVWCGVMAGLNQTDPLLAAGVNCDIALEAAILFKEKKWRLLLIDGAIENNSRYAVFPDPDGRLRNFRLGALPPTESKPLIFS